MEFVIHWFQHFQVVASLLAVAIIGSWFNFISVIYIGQWSWFLWINWYISNYLLWILDDIYFNMFFFLHLIVHYILFWFIIKGEISTSSKLMCFPSRWFFIALPDFLKFVLFSQGFVAAHTLPVLYERNEDQVDTFVYQVFDQMQHNYKKLDTGFISKIPKGRFNVKKFE